MQSLTIDQYRRLEILRDIVIEKINNSSETETRKAILTDKIKNSYNIYEIRGYLEEEERDSILDNIESELKEKVARAFGKSADEIDLNEQEVIDNSPIEYVEGSITDSITQLLGDDDDENELNEALAEQLEQFDEEATELEEVTAEAELIEDIENDLDTEYVEVDPEEEADEDEDDLSEFAGDDDEDLMYSEDDEEDTLEEFIEDDEDELLADESEEELDEEQVPLDENGEVDLEALVGDSDESTLNEK